MCVCDSFVGVHRYTRWTGRLSHQTSNLSHPHDLLPEGCDLCFAQYQVQGDVGSDLPTSHQTTEVTLTQGSPERSGYIHMDKQVTQSILVHDVKIHVIFYNQITTWDIMKIIP